MERPRNGAPGIQMKDVPTLNLGKNGESSGTLNSHRSNSSKNSRSQPNTRPSSAQPSRYRIYDANVDEEEDEEAAKRRMEDEINLRDINLREKTDDRMVFRKVPFALWIVGTMILVTAIYLLYTLALGYFGVLYKGPKQGHWWQYLVVVLLFLLALSFFLAGHIDSIVFDKVQNELQVWRISLYCVKSCKRYPLDEISDVKAYKNGHQEVNIYTLHYKIVVIFKNGGYEPVNVLETAI
jgi:hypothetical protein